MAAQAKLRIEIAGVRWWLRSGADPEHAATRIERALAALHAGRAANVKTGRRKELYPLRLEKSLEGSAEPDHQLKVNRYGGRGRWPRALRPSKSRRELVLAERIAARGLPTPVPLAAGELRRGGLLECCFLLVPLLPGARDLRSLWFEGPLPASERRALVGALGTLARELADAGVFQDDFAANNFLRLPGAAPRLRMVDLERVRIRRSSLGPGARRWMLAKLDRELDANLGERMRFLRAYARNDAAEARRWWRDLEAFAPRLARRDLGRLRRTATTTGRRFRPVHRDGLRGYAEAGADLDALPLAGEPGRPATTPRVETLGPLWRVTHPPLSRRETDRVWCLAWLLWLRGGLGPRPLAILGGGDRALPFLARPGGATPLGGLDDPAGRGAVRALLRRLLVLGELEGVLAPEALALVPRARGGRRAALLTPHRLRLPGHGCADARGREERLLEGLGGARPG